MGVGEGKIPWSMSGGGRGHEGRGAGRISIVLFSCRCHSERPIGQGGVMLDKTSGYLPHG